MLTVYVWLMYAILQSSNPPFTSIEMDHSDSGREGCTVTTLTVTAEPKNWRDAIKVAVHEVCTNFFLDRLEDLIYYLRNMLLHIYFRTEIPVTWSNLHQFSNYQCCLCAY